FFTAFGAVFFWAETFSLGADVSSPHSGIARVGGIVCRFCFSSTKILRLAGRQKKALSQRSAEFRETGQIARVCLKLRLIIESFEIMTSCQPGRDTSPRNNLPNSAQA